MLLCEFCFSKVKILITYLKNLNFKSTLKKFTFFKNNAQVYNRQNFTYQHPINLVFIYNKNYFILSANPL
jgi:hypothetical protein